MEYQTEVEIALDVEEEKAAEIKNQVQTAKNSLEAQTTSSSHSVDRGGREDGKQDAWNGPVQVASQATAVPEQYGPDAERQEVKRDEQEFRKAQQQFKKTTQARARRERSVIINEYESDKITSNEAILTATRGARRVSTAAEKRPHRAAVLRGSSSPRRVVVGWSRRR